MTENINKRMSITEAVIYLKDGKRKHGMLIEEMINDAYQFISNTNYSLYKKDKNLNYIEKVPCSLIDTIDTSLK
ncbi:MAG TPA: hypothetical protein VJI69_09790 [Bacteroidia bacterium]|nr:hypothetical protein [Bacteroidia bacterium]